MTELVEALSGLQEYDARLHARVLSSLDIIDRALTVYSPSELSFSFNGGKDSTVVLHLLRLQCSQCLKAGVIGSAGKYRNKDLAGMQIVLFITRDTFPEERAFIEEMMRMYNLRIDTYEGYKEGLEQIISGSCVRGIFMGTRKDDPHGGSQNPFEPTSRGWPPIMRINPILHWEYQDIWTFLRFFKLPTCALYAEGYTSIGSMHDTIPNPLLATTELLDELELHFLSPATVVPCALDSNCAEQMPPQQAPVPTSKLTSCHYLPAWHLADASAERAGRGKMWGEVASALLAARVERYPQLYARGTPHACNIQLERQSRVTAGLVVIGDELLNGTVTDVNTPFLLKHLSELGVHVQEVTVLGDELSDIASCVRRFSKLYAYVLTCGGIGPTHDDITLQGIAAAFGKKLICSKPMMEFLTSKYGADAHSRIQKFAWLPEDSNVLSAAEIFDGSHPLSTTIADDVRLEQEYPLVCVKNVYIFPGVPSMLERKFKLFASLFRGEKDKHTSVMLRAQEHTIADELEAIHVEFLGRARIGSYPLEDGEHVTVTVISSSNSELEKAVHRVRSQFEAKAPAHAHKRVRDEHLFAAKVNAKTLRVDMQMLLSH